MTPEAKVKARIVRVLQKHGAYFFFPAMGLYGRAGIPDILGHSHGRFFAIEVKAGGNTPTELQSAELGKIITAGGFATWINERNYTKRITELEKWLVEDDEHIV